MFSFAKRKFFFSEEVALYRKEENVQKLLKGCCLFGKKEGLE